MSSQSSNMSRSLSREQACLDPMDALIDFSGGEYETMTYQSPSLSPSTTSKPQFVRPVSSATPTANNAMLSSSQQTMSGPSHQYDLYKQQTGIPTGAIANTLAMQGNMFNYNFSDLNPEEDFNDYHPMPQPFTGLDMEIEYDSPSNDATFFYPESTLPSQEFVNPSAIQDINSIPSAPVVPTQTSNVGRLWPGMHQQQAAIAKAQEQQKRQQQLIQQQRQSSSATQHRPRPKTQAADPLVEEKISQLLNSMRQSSVSTSEAEDMANQGHSHAQRLRKEEEDMDEDERLLASEEGKKLSSKERRQLRNKVSARAFRSRRKEYIGQLEGEIAGKVNENADLRSQNRALMEENTRLSDLTRMLLSSPSFSGFLDTLSTNPNGAAPQTQQAPAPVPEQRTETRQVRKDVNPYASQIKQQSQPQMHMALIPEIPMDFSMLDLNVADGYGYQPQVFSVLELPEVSIDTSILSGKTSETKQLFESDNAKVELPTIERMPVKEEASESVAVVADETDLGPAFDLFSTVSAPSTQLPRDIETLLAGIRPKSSYEMVVVPSNASSNAAMAKVDRLCASLEAATARLEAMTVSL